MIYYAYMIGYLSGTIIFSNEKWIIMDVGGVGYKVFVSPAIIQQGTVGSNVSLWIYTAVREDTLDLFGFETQSIQELFELLINVSGIGPKSALGILAIADISSLVHAIKTENVGYLTQVSGVGKKTAEKIVLELKDKIERLSLTHTHTEADYLTDVVDALLAMGYHERSVRETLRTMNTDDTDTSRIIREALQILGK